MTPSPRISPEQLRDFLEVFPDFLEGLVGRGYGVGAWRHLAVHELVGSLVARDGLPGTLGELDDWLAPLLCSTPEQQNDFRGLYLRWLGELGLPAVPDPPPVQPPPDLELTHPPPPPPQLPESIFDWLHEHRLPLLACGAALLAGALFVAYRVADIYRQGEELAQFVVPKPPVTDPTPVPLPTAETTPTPDRRRAPPPPDVGRAWDVDKPADGRLVRGDQKPWEPTDPPLPGFWVEVWERAFPLLVALVLLPPYVGLWLWRRRRSRRRREEAERWGKEKPDYDKIKVRGARERVFQSQALRPIARGLRRYRSVESRLLDAPPTVLATVRRGGLFTPVYGRRRALPEYLVLIDSVGFGDQLAQFNSDIVTRLTENDVYVNTYYFHGDPRRCHDGRRDSPQISLSDLAARHPEHHLLVFSDGTGLMSTTTGQPEPFVQQFHFWDVRALLTPIPRAEWDYREWSLEREGLLVLPATLDGLRALAEAVGPDARAPRPPGFDSTPPYPDILREQPSLWKERRPPRQQSQRLLRHLRRYLGPRGYELLCACAVYPVMQWGVTLFLSYELLGPREVDELLPRLLRLPWFRNGTMPQWLRRLLVRELPRPRRRLVRERLEHLLLAFLEDPKNGLRPRSPGEAAAGTSLASRLRGRLAAWQRRRRLLRHIEPATARSPLADPVFFGFITNNDRPGDLLGGLRQGLFRRGVAAFGLRLGPALALISAVALATLFGLLLNRPVHNIYTPGYPPDLAERLRYKEPLYTTDPAFSYTPTAARRGETVDVTVRVVTPGAYDLSRVSLAPKVQNGGISVARTAAAPGLTYQTSVGNSDVLTTSVVVASDAPLGPTELLLNEGDKLRARLPFTVTDAPPPPAPASTQTCPTIQLFTGSTSSSRYTTITATVLGALPNAKISYTWGTKGTVTIFSGEGTRSLQVFPDPNVGGQKIVTLTVGGLPAGCPNVKSVDLGSPPPPPRPFDIEPGTITVCQSDPKLNNPPGSLIKVQVPRGVLLTNTTDYDADVTGGKIRRTGLEDAGMPTYEWDLSGVSPGTYTVTVWPYTRDQSAFGRVSVRGCPGAGAGEIGPMVVTVVDEAGRPVAGARVYLRSRLGTSTASTSDNGQALFNNLPAGTYKASAEARGYVGLTTTLVFSPSRREQTIRLRSSASAPSNANARPTPPTRPERQR